ncbi:plasmid partitioning protein RepB [Methylosinus sp. PW1]|uniref:plasmid partitioning protein RepB n=1 Tax=Methylosinus sp. PW1 TaxID=107636 RepID=UPI00055FF3CD|nr:plasmid partitioning protein RepB [Methylosinus sp. PW1]
MSRKNIFAAVGQSKFAAANDREVKVADRPLADATERLNASASPVGSLGRVLNDARQKSLRAEEMERSVRDACAVIELNPQDIEPSFARDRMAGYSPEDLDDSFLASIRSNGQQVPVLVRPHPTQAGRYETAYGHRRIAAARILGRTVRAVVKSMSDDELVVAQGQENVERNGLSFIEKCRFAYVLESRSFTRETISGALSVHKTILSIMVSLIERLPSDVIDAIGPAPSTGRRAWSQLADRLDSTVVLDRVRNVIANPEKFAAAKSSDERFRLLLAVATEKVSAPRKQTWSRADGRSFASLAVSEAKIILSVDRHKHPEIAEVILRRLSALQAELENPENDPMKES